MGEARFERDDTLAFVSHLIGEAPMLIRPLAFVALVVGLSGLALAQTPVGDEGVGRWLRAHALPIASVHAESGFDDLQPLKELLRGVRVVGLGEATHGTSEFFTLKHRLLEFLVREMGFRVFAIESAYAQCENINDYVMGRTDDVKAALASQRFWTVNHEEMLALVNWMRTYNAGVSESERVSFVGIDIQHNARGKAAILAYLRPRAVNSTPDFESLLAIDDNAVVQRVFNPNERDDALIELERLRSRYLELLGYLALKQREYVAQTSPEEFQQVRRYVQVLAQYVDAYRRGPGTRDRYMAENVLEELENGGRGGGVVLWAHNGHIARSPNTRAMGQYLRRELDDAYYALGFTFNQGAFQARSPVGVLREFTVGPAPPGTVERVLAEAGIGDSLIDFRHAQPSPAVSDLLGTPRRMRSIGATYAANAAVRGVFAAPGHAFDGLIFLETTTRARPLDTVANVMR
jgi:erythromycin esterase